MDTKDMIFVFGSNTGGIHGGGAAKAARVEHGAQWGVGFGITGRSFAIPTKGHIDRYIGDTLPLWEINRYVDIFILYADQHPNLNFQVTAIGCGLAGLKHSDIAPMFDDAPYNCFFDTQWRPYLTRDESHFWGTYG